MNLRAALPEGTGEKEIRRQTDAVLQNFSAYWVDLAYSRRLTDEFIQRNADVKGLEYLEQALSRKKGVILVSAHLGNWELGAMLMSRLGYPVHALALKHKDEGVNRIFSQRRRRHHLKIIYVGNILRGAFGVLRKNEILALNGDRLYSGEGIRVSFMGRDVDFPAGFSRISLHTGAATLPAFFTYEAGGRYRMEIEKPLGATDEKAMTQEFAERAQARIRQYPAQWLLFEPFWETPAWPV